MTPKLALLISVSALTLLAGCGGSGPSDDLAAPRASDSPALTDESVAPSASPSKAQRPAKEDGAKGGESKKPKPKPTTAAPKPSASQPKPKPTTPKPTTPTTPKPKPTTPEPTPKPTTPPPVASGGGMTKVELKVLELTNAERAKAGCPALKANAKLARAAQKHSKDMAVNNYFSHTSQDGRSPWDRIKAEGYMDPGAENIAAGYPTAAAVVKGWMDSSGHRANILNCKLKALGVGEYKNYWTQNFGWT
ncbi:CAP domain-containing protein [Actinocorallia sp. A-T 12471]|uniref:CAP domain-containing protein n=1 Tax=Actinocorallia sp. A-T 12471 TaxID=3089813 RepID=UPI0029D19CA7|nr:CAP domain-containing protein [Actinocorallia sp. A-T 12471]MDX6739793.1 CAP domain-containing protein [Actinocorallia sp. A-T 12471]